MKSYWAMSDGDLELEARRYKIGEYFDGHSISRERIISQLIAKDSALEVPKASLRSWIALAISVVSFLVSISGVHIR